LGILIPEAEVLGVSHQIHEKVHSQFNSILFSTILISILLVGLTLLVATYFALRATKQIRLLTDGVTMLKQKKYNVSLDIVAQNDLGDLTQAFNEMSQELHTSYTKLQEHASQLEETVKERTLHLEQANHALQELSNHDGLTKVNNRLHFDAYLEMKWREYTRNALPLSCIMIDIDNFKEYNDTYGHQEGDNCLKAVAHALHVTLFRHADFLARYGGEEFVVIVNDGIEGAQQLAERLRLAVEKLALKHSQTSKGIVSISLGVSSLVPTQGVNADVLVKIADQALYASKDGGRDRVSVGELD